MEDNANPIVHEFRTDPASFIETYGPAIDIEVAGSRLTALLDTGAAFSGIDISKARELDLVEGGSHDVVGVTGRGTYPMFIADLLVPRLGLTLQGPLPAFPLRQNHLWCSAIVGRDVICRYEFTINARTGLIRFTEL